MCIALSVVRVRFIINRAPNNLESCFDATTYVISRRVTRPTLVGTTWFDEMCESTKAPKAMR